MQAMEGDEDAGQRRQKGKKRRRTGADSGDEDVMSGGGAAESYGQRAAAKTAEQILQEMELREASREEVKALLRAVMMVSAGAGLGSRV